MREPAPPYANEGPHALWHVSEDDSIARFEPHRGPTSTLEEKTRTLAEEVASLRLAVRRLQSATAEADRSVDPTEHREH